MADAATTSRTLSATRVGIYVYATVEVVVGDSRYVAETALYSARGTASVFNVRLVGANRRRMSRKSARGALVCAAAIAHVEGVAAEVAARKAAVAG